MADNSSTETPLEANSVRQSIADKRMHEHVSGGDSYAVEGNENAPHVGMVFKTYEEVYEFYNKYARQIGFGIKVRSSRYNEDGCQQFSLACCKEGKEKVCMYRLRVSAKTNCQARIKARKLWVDGLFHLIEVKLEHNHPVNPQMARFFRSNKKLLRNNKHLECNNEGGIQPDSSYTIQAEGHENPSLGEGDCRIPTERVRRLGFGKADVEVILQYFFHMKSRNPNFYYAIDVDDEGRIRNVFWADGTCRAACQYFGDVVSFDTTYLTNNYDTPFAPFVGVNHHGQSVLLGCSLLAVETVETYITLFKAWLSCMAGRPPSAIITDHCEGIQEAAADVFPRARHRLCLWQVMKRIPEKLAGITECKAILRTLKNVVYDSLKADEFEVNWRKMIEEYEIQDNEWLQSLYENRHRWVPVFVKDTFWAGMSTIRRGESLSSFFDGHVHPDTSLKQFFNIYETVLQSKYEMEARADFDSFDKHPKLISQLSMEEQLSKMYTINMFKKFQEEVKALMYCHAMRTIDGPISTFEVKERVRMKDDKRMEHRFYKVLYDANDVEVQCLCGYFPYSGVLCRHALSVLNFHDVDEIPPRYILDRWKKDYKCLHASACSMNDPVAIGSIERYDDLCKRCLELAEMASMSEDQYKLVLKILQETKEKLLGNHSFGASQPKTVSCETRTSVTNCLIEPCSNSVVIGNGNRNVANDLDRHVDTELNCPVQKRKRGRPPKVSKETLVEKTINTAMKKVSERTSSVDKQSVLIPFTPTTPYLVGPVGTHPVGIHEIANFKEHVYPTNSLIGNYRGVQVNPQHIIGYQSGMQWSIEPTLQEFQRTKEPSGSNTG